MSENKTVKFKTLVWRFRETGMQYPDLADMPKKKITSPEEFYKLFKPVFHEQSVEIFVVAWLSSSNRVIGYEVVSTGLLNSSLVDSRGVFRGAIVSNAASLILAHNHPSGNPEASEEDISITRKLVESGKVLGIHVFDHLIFAGDSYTSFVEKRLI